MPRTLIIAVSLLLAGCVTYSSSGGQSVSLASHLNYATKSGRLAVMVLGDPLPANRDTIEAMFVRALDSNFAGLKTTFAPTKLMVPAADKILLVFDPEATAIASELCRAPLEAKHRHQGPKMRAGMIFCFGRARAEAWATLPRPGSVSDPLLAEVIEGLAFHMIPDRQSNSY
jgi:hypothetical protein